MSQSLAAFPDALAGSRIRSGAAGTGAVTPLGEAPVRVVEAAAAQWPPQESNLGYSVLFLSLCIWLAWEYT